MSAPNTPPAATTLSSMIAAAQIELRWFDLGRRVRPLPRKTTEAFEAGTAPWPYPYLRQAWCGLLLKQTEGEAVVWFLRLPLDEQGKLQLPVRDQFLRQLSEALSIPHGQIAPERLNGDSHTSPAPAARLQRALDNSGLIYTPPTERRAVFHAKAAQLLGRPASEHFATAKHYWQNPDNLPWQQVALQGIADLCVRWQKHLALLLSSMPEIAPAAFISLGLCLESEAIDHQLTEALLARARAQLTAKQPDLALITAAIRGTSHAVADGLRQQFLLELLTGKTDAGNTPRHSIKNSAEILAAVGSRCQQDLLRPEIASAWLNALAELQAQPTFNLLLTDLLFLPEIRSALLDVLRDPNRPEALAKAFGNFLQQGTS